VANVSEDDRRYMERLGRHLDAIATDEPASEAARQRQWPTRTVVAAPVAFRHSQMTPTLRQ
jgi:hypothetical protein